MSHQLIELFPGIAEKQYFQNPETKEFWFHATAVCRELEFENTSRSLMLHTDEDERFQEIFEGRTVWFISEAGCYGLALASKSEKAKKFKRWLKHDVLPKLRASGYYIASNATSEQLESMQKELNRYKSEVAFINSEIRGVDQYFR
jgi:prophage antirepressor-like protein